MSWAAKDDRALLFAARAKVHPDGESTGDEALQKYDSDRHGQEPLLAPQWRVLPHQPVVNRGLVEAVRFARREAVQRRTYCFFVGRLRGRSILGLLVVQRRCLCIICLYIFGVVSWTHFTRGARSHGCNSTVVGAKSRDLSAKAHPRANRTGSGAFRLIDSRVGQHL